MINTESSFTWEELRDIEDKERMSFIGQRQHYLGDNECGICIYGGYIECFAPIGIKRICENLKSDKIKSLIGKPYWENRHLLKYGGDVDTKGIIREAYMKEEMKLCSKHKKFRHKYRTTKLFKEDNKTISSVVNIIYCESEESIRINHFIVRDHKKICSSKRGITINKIIKRDRNEENKHRENKIRELMSKDKNISSKDLHKLTVYSSDIISRYYMKIRRENSKQRISQEDNFWLDTEKDLNSKK